MKKATGWAMRAVGLMMMVWMIGAATAQYHLESPYTEPCSGGQGILYSDSDFQHCECFNCFMGERCEKPISNCPVDCSGGNPTLAQQYWEQVQLPESVTLSEAYYRSPYMLHGGVIAPEPVPAYQLDRYLRTSITNLHKMVGNAEYEKAYIVYGQGGTQLINAAAYALALKANKILPVFAQSPYFNQYRDWASFNRFNNYWNASYDQTDYAEEVIEFVTAPNNPTGEMRTPHYNSSANIVYDMVYYWPTWTNITYRASHDIMIFSLSKLTGHAGTRFGWALVKDHTVAENMRSFIRLMNIHTSLDSLHRSIRILTTLVNQKGDFFTSIAAVMTSRYARLLPLFANHSKFTVESVTDPPTWYYLWIKCEDENVSCYDVFLNANIKGRPGSLYGASDQYVRLQLTLRSVDFEILFNNLQTLLTL